MEQAVLGKSFFTKLQILRYSMLGVEQYVIDPDREYTNIAKELEGTILKIGPSSETYINVLDIRRESIEDEKGYLATKISRLIGFFNLIFGEMDEEEKAILEEKIIECYKEKNITFDDESLYVNEDDRTGDRTTPRPAINPIMAKMGDAISMNPDNTVYTGVNDDGEIVLVDKPSE